MQIIPVLDLLNQKVVRGVAGNRELYRPVCSRLCPESEPLAVASAFRRELGLDSLYVADLDGILRSQPGLDCYRVLADAGFRLLVDSGMRDLTGAEGVLEAGAEAVVAGLETSAGPAQLGELCRELGPERVLFSLDLKHGQLLTAQPEWDRLSPLVAAQAAAAQGVRRVIVLDLAGVGVGKGVPTLALCREIRAACPDLQLITGGGIRDGSDLDLLAAEGIDGVLVASALHDGHIGRAEIQHAIAGSRGSDMRRTHG